MPINQPPIAEDFTQSSWQYEVTRFVNELEQQLGLALQTIEELEARVEELENP